MSGHGNLKRTLHCEHLRTLKDWLNYLGEAQVSGEAQSPLGDSKMNSSSLEKHPENAVFFPTPCDKMEELIHLRPCLSTQP